MELVEIARGHVQVARQLKNQIPRHARPILAESLLIDHFLVRLYSDTILKLPIELTIPPEINAFDRLLSTR